MTKTLLPTSLADKSVYVNRSLWKINDVTLDVSSVINYAGELHCSALGVGAVQCTNTHDVVRRSTQCTSVHHCACLRLCVYLSVSMCACLQKSIARLLGCYIASHSVDLDDGLTGVFSCSNITSRISSNCPSQLTVRITHPTIFTVDQELTGDAAYQPADALLRF